MKTAVRFSFFILFFFSAVFSFASSVSVFMYQKDAGVDLLRGTTIAVENEVLETLFDSGYIVSSVAAAKTDADINQALAEALKNSAEGFFDIMVQITVRYNDIIPENPAKIVFSDIQSIDWRIFRVKNKTCIAEKKQDIGQKYEGETDSKALKRVAKEVGYAIEKILQGVR
ncbi:hypothetical protein H0R92_10390 [Treponema sp. OMZ 840]|uniref:hypothetical protein n=1 Tax=Treponema sp. OMZ 840 TaxID=244313 RepID=UPI003D8D0781